MKTYTLLEINRAWIEFKKPVREQIGEHGITLFNEETGENEVVKTPYFVEVKRKDFISFLIEFYSEDKL